MLVSYYLLLLLSKRSSFTYSLFSFNVFPSISTNLKHFDAFSGIYELKLIAYLLFIKYIIYLKLNLLKFAFNLIH